MFWNKENYQRLIDYMLENADIKYRDFQAKIIKDDNVNLIGIRIPDLKKIAKFISKNDYMEFIKLNRHEFYEENVLHGLILGYIKVPTDELLKLVDEFIPYIDNWATNDITDSNLKAFKTIDVSHVLNYVKSSNPWEVRFGFTLLLSHYVTECNLDIIFKACNDNKKTDYYVGMAIAWLLSVCYIKHPKKTKAYLLKNDLEKFTLNKTISKICDSYRVPKETKNELKKLRK